MAEIDPFNIPDLYTPQFDANGNPTAKPMNVRQQQQQSAAPAPQSSGMDGVQFLLSDILARNPIGDSIKQELTSSNVDDKTKLAAVEDKYLRLYADFDNHKKRTAKERQEEYKVAGKGVVLLMLPIMDDYERMLKTIKSPEIRAGLQVIYNKMLANLTSIGVKAMESTGHVFNPELHESITQVPAAKDKVGKVVDTIEKGYYLNDKLIRFAKVVIGK